MTKLTFNTRALSLVLLVAIALPAMACRYSVREVGFVDLDEAPYQFYLYPGDAPADVVARVKRAAYTAFIDAHVLIHEVGPDSQPETDYAKRHHLETFPAGVFVAPEGQSLPVTFPEAALADDDGLLALLHPLVTSPKRDVLLEKVIEPFCTLLLIHGDDEKLNVTTKARIEAAIVELTDNMDQLEKGTEVPPQLVELTIAERATEAPLLWSLGLSPTVMTEPRVAVLFGRARRMGSILRGDRVSQESLMEVMTLIGASCECGLDRKWMQGPMLPLEWDSTDQAELAAHLGFDPESPLVKTEISQIIAQGMAQQGSGTKMDSILGVDEAEGRRAAASVEMEDILVAENVPLEETVVEDVPLSTSSTESTTSTVDSVDGVDLVDEVDNNTQSEGPIGRSKEGEITIDLPPVSISNDKGGIGVLTSITVEFWPNPVIAVIVILIILVNIVGALYLFRKRSRN